MCACDKGGTGGSEGGWGAREREGGIVRIGEGCGLAEGWGSQRQRNGEREVEGGKTE